MGGAADGRGVDARPERDDLKKQHPGLVPYAALPESEKEYDRSTVLGVLRAILAMGYRIERAR